MLITQKDLFEIYICMDDYSCFMNILKPVIHNLRKLRVLSEYFDIPFMESTSVLPCHYRTFMVQSMAVTFPSPVFLRVFSKQTMVK